MKKFVFAIMVLFALNMLMADTPPITLCEDDSDCPRGQICNGDICVEGCGDDADCATDEKCEGGICREACTSDAQCQDGSECIGGMCEGIFCRSDADCPGNSKCVNMHCAMTPADNPCYMLPIFVAGFVGYALFAKKN
ncbi:MAG: hypothetical protein ABIH83_00500 [Candidatus Micrarchaeota archaeon]